MIQTALETDVHVFLHVPPSNENSPYKNGNFRVLPVLKTPCILGRVLEFHFFLEKSLNLCASP